MNNETLDTVLATNDISKIYHKESLPFQQKRYNSFIDLFKSIYELNPQFISRAPGRVNLIGEHIDYAGYAVLPMAIENDALIGGSYSRSSTISSILSIRLKHENKSLEEKEFQVNLNNRDHLKIVPPKSHSWVTYFIAGYNCIVEHLLTQGLLDDSLLKMTHINLLVTGNVPFASGLSSSSSLTVCAAITFLHIFGLSKTISKQDLAELTIKYERSIGTACGGMDQTICLFGENNKAKLIDFNPISLRDINLPPSVSFIVANSLTPSAKIDTLAFRYNKRVVENKLGIALIAKMLNLNACSFSNLIQLQKELQVSFFQLRELISEYLIKDKYTIDEIEQSLGMKDLDQILNAVPYYRDVLNNNTEYFLKQRLLHVASEAERVIQFAFTSTGTDHETVKELGILMNLSHTSCKNDYDCSSENLDKLVELFIKNGAYGSRLTGAGWGGCTISMIDSQSLDKFMTILKKYYEENHNTKNEIDLKDVFFITKPGQGACIYIVN